MISVNGKTYSGKNLVINNGDIIIDGVKVSDEDAKQITIQITGDLENLNVDSCDLIEVTGSCNNVKTVSGDVQIGKSVKGDVQTVSGDVNSLEIKGIVKTVSGDVSKKFKKKNRKNKSFFSFLSKKNGNSVIQSNQGIIKGNMTGGSTQINQVHTGVGDNIVNSKTVTNIGTIKGDVTL